MTVSKKNLIEELLTLAKDGENPLSDVLQNVKKTFLKLDKNKENNELIDFCEKEINGKSIEDYRRITTDLHESKKEKVTFVTHRFFTLIQDKVNQLESKLKIGQEKFVYTKYEDDHYQFYFFKEEDYQRVYTAIRYKLIDLLSAIPLN